MPAAIGLLRKLAGISTKSKANIDDSPSDQPHVDEVYDQLTRILASATFPDSPRLTRFLKFVVEAIAGDSDSIKAYTIAVKALGLGSDFDPQSDPIVRVQAVRLRKALARYYAGAGSDDPIVIELPRGNYVPAFRRRSFVPPLKALSIEILRAENRRIRNLIISLVTILLRKIAFDPFIEHQGISSADAEHFLREAEECFRCARGLDAAGHELTAKAVEIETMLQREKWKNNNR
jgi:hypothetical protein